jgi:SAM-dependent methyltransferase
MSANSDSPSVIRDGRLDLAMLSRLTRRPRLFSGRANLFWIEPYVAEHLLEAHLDPDTEAATRPPREVKLTVETILGHLGAASDRNGPQRSALDLACGPGFYAERFAAAGLQVTGIDISQHSLDYAVKSASDKGLSITYRRGDMRRVRQCVGHRASFDLVTLIYGEFCTLSDPERAALLHNVRQILKPGGLFVFDVFTEHLVRRTRTGNDWHVAARNGFWAETPHMVLEQVFHYPERSTSVQRYTVIDESGGCRQFSVWWRHYTHEEIRRETEDAGFIETELYGSLWGEPVKDGDEWIGVFCRASLS